jgi:hypothetical protein
MKTHPFQNGIEMNGSASATGTASTAKQQSNSAYATTNVDSGDVTINGNVYNGHAAIQSSTQNILEDTDDDDGFNGGNAMSDNSENARNAAIANSSSFNRAFENEESDEGGITSHAGNVNVVQHAAVSGLTASARNRTPSPHIYANQMSQGFHADGSGIYHQQMSRSGNR